VRAKRHKKVVNTKQARIRAPHFSGCFIRGVKENVSNEAGVI
jgi:hypothetical protein